MLRITDQLGSTIQFDSIPNRIVSLVPSQTELLHSLGLQGEVIGITKFCVHPQEWFRTKTRVGGTKTVNLELVRSIKPDLVIANKEENMSEQVMAISEFCPVYTSDIYNLETALGMIRQLGELTGKHNVALALNATITEKFQHLQQHINIKSPVKTAYLIWKDPWMAAGGDTFVNDLLSRCGLTNILVAQPRYPKVNIDQLRSSGCELLLLSSEPYPFANKHIAELRQLLPNTKIMLVDGEMFSWYGSRLLKAADYFRSLVGIIHGKPLN